MVTVAVAIFVAMDLTGAVHEAAPMPPAQSPNQPPSAAIVVTPEPLSPAQLQINFGLIEEALADAEIDANGNVVLGTPTGGALTQAVAALPEEVSAEIIERVQLLIRKGMRGKAGEQFARLLDEYYRYTQIERREIGVDTSRKDLDTQIALFHKTIALRERHFGKARADKLFGEHHELIALFLDLRKIAADPTLSESQRQARQQARQRAFDKRKGRA